MLSSVHQISESESFKSILRKMKALEKVHMIKDSEQKPVSGGFNKITFKEAPEVLCAHDVGEVGQKLKFAKTKHKPNLEIREEKNCARGIELLNQKGIPHIYFYYDSEKRFSETSSGDFFDFVATAQQAEKLNISTVKKYMGQILLEVNLLHSKNVVHQDLKLENLLMMKSKSGAACVKLIDFDDVEAVNEDGHAVSKHFYFKTGTKEHDAPEKFNTDAATADLKAIDRYAVGMIFLKLMFASNMIKNWRKGVDSSVKEGMVEQLNKVSFPLHRDRNNKIMRHVFEEALLMLLPHTGEKLNTKELDERYALYQLIVSLIQKSPEKRATLSQTMNSPFFEKGFFDNLRAESEYQLILNGTVFDSTKMKKNDCSILLPQKIQKLLQVAEPLAEQIGEASVLVAGLQQDEFDEIETLIEKMEEVKSNTPFVKKLAIEASEIPEFSADLTQLNVALENEMQSLEKRQTEKGALILQCMVEASIKEFALCYKLEKGVFRCAGFFSSSQVKQLEQAQELSRQVADAVWQDKSFTEVFDMIYAAMGQQKGEFVNILNKHLFRGVQHNLTSWGESSVNKTTLKHTAV